LDAFSKVTNHVVRRRCGLCSRCIGFRVCAMVQAWRQRVRGASSSEMSVYIRVCACVLRLRFASCRCC
jgi:hypothetical protein